MPTPQTVAHAVSEQKREANTNIRVYPEASLQLLAIQGILADRGERATYGDIVERALAAYRRELEQEAR